MGDRIGKMMRRRAKEDARNAAWLSLWDAQGILDRTLDRDEEMTLEMLDECRNHIKAALEFFAEDD